MASVQLEENLATSVTGTDGVPSGAGRWISRGAWAIADQGFFASSNFALNVLLARWLSPAEYGGFVFAFFLFLLLATVHNGFLIEPMLVFGPSNYQARHGMYRGAMLHLHLLFSLPLTGVLLVGAGAAWWFGSLPLAGALAALSIAGPAILLLWLMRRMCYLDAAPHRAAIAGMFYVLLMIVAIFALEHFNALGIISALGTLGGCSLICSLGLMVSEKARWPTREQRAQVREVRLRHLRYSRWASTGALVGFIPGQAYYLLLPLLVSTQSAGILRGLTNPILPLQQATVAMWVLLLPRLSALRGTREFYRTMRTMLILIVGGSLLYWVLCGLLHQPIIHLLYADGDGDGEFKSAAWLLWLIGFQPVLQAFSAVYGSAVLANQRPDRYFYAQVASSVVALTLGVFLVMRQGVLGAAIATLVNLAVQAAVLIYYTHKRSAPLADKSDMQSGLQSAGARP